MVAHPVPTTEARRDLNKILKRFRAEGPVAEPVLFGAHRRPEAVILPYGTYEVMQDLIEDTVIAAEIRDRDLQDDGERITVDELADELGVTGSHRRSLAERIVHRALFRVRDEA